MKRRQKSRLEAASHPTPHEPLIDPEAEAAAAIQALPSPEVRPQEEVVIPQNPPSTPARRFPAAMIHVCRGVRIFQCFHFPVSFFGGASNWAEALGFGIAFEGDAYVLRALIINGPDSKANAIPFVPQFISGPAIVPESPSVFPANTDLFVTLSLDYPQVYEGMLKSIASMDEMAKKYGGRQASAPAPESPFAVYEKQLGSQNQGRFAAAAGKRNRDRTSPAAKAERGRTRS